VTPSLSAYEAGTTEQPQKDLDEDDREKNGDDRADEGFHDGHESP
jgi:hypothetical protein